MANCIWRCFFSFSGLFYVSLFRAGFRALLWGESEDAEASSFFIPEPGKEPLIHRRKGEMKMITSNVSLVNNANIKGYLLSMPCDIKKNISLCLEKWLMGENSYGYPHPVHVCHNLQASHNRQPFLTPQQYQDLQSLKSCLKRILN